MSDDLTPKELNELSTKMNDAFLKEFGDDIFAGIPNNSASFHPTAANSKSLTIDHLLKMKHDLDRIMILLVSTSHPSLHQSRGGLLRCTARFVR